MTWAGVSPPQVSDLIEVSSKELERMPVESLLALAKDVGVIVTTAVTKDVLLEKIRSRAV